MVKTIRYPHIVWELPLVVAGTLLLSARSKLRAVEERTLKDIWAFGKNAFPVLVHNERVLAWVDKKARFIDVGTGKLRRSLDWPIALDAAISGDFFIGKGYKSGDYLYAARLSSGKVLWTFRPPEQHNSISCTFSATDKGVFFGLSDGSLVGLSLKNGRELWRTQAPRMHGAQMWADRVAVAYGDKIIFAVRHGIIAVSAKTGKIVWRRRLDDTAEDVTLYDGRYYTLTNFGHYYVINPNNGNTLTHHDLRSRLPKSLSRVRDFFPMLISETHLFVGSSVGHLLAFERDTGDYVWSHRPTGGSSFQRQTYFMSANNRLYYADMSFRLYIMEGASEPASATPKKKTTRRK